MPLYKHNISAPSLPTTTPSRGGDPAGVETSDGSMRGTPPGGGGVILPQASRRRLAVKRGPRIGLALGGGAARGLAHIGVLQAFGEAGLQVAALAGTSMGAIVAASYASDPDPDRLAARFREYLRDPEFRKSQINFFKNRRKLRQKGLFYNFANLIRKGIYYGFSLTSVSFVSAPDFRRGVEAVVPNLWFETLRRPLRVVATDLKTGDRVVLQRGPVRPAILASAAIPGVLPPVEMEGKTLADGGLVERVPARTLREMDVDVVIGVDVSNDMADTANFQTGMSILLRAHAIRALHLHRFQVRDADLVLQPDLDQIHWADFDRVDDCIRLGAEAVHQRLPEILRLIHRAGWKRFLPPLLSGKHRRPKP